MTAVEILKKYWGYTSFRPMQEEIVESILARHDTLGLMPTGGGKSITFQVPAMMFEGVTVVITPLISLMKDQVDNLRKRHIKAVCLHSGLSAPERRIAREKLWNGGAKLLYVSPERLRNGSFLQELRQLKVSLIVVDEAHCISQWGYDFRPAYLKIASLRKELPGVPVLALTASATPEVEADICERLEMKDSAVLRMSFSRSNLNYIVRPSETKLSEVLHILSHTAGSAIVYVRSRKRTKEIADYLQECGISAAHFHAGLDPELKRKSQDAWKQGAIRVMVATNAFGMGIDKPDVRVVIHYDTPPSLEEYYQEAGRAGRDGQTAYAVLLRSVSDKANLRRKLSLHFPPRDYILKVYERVCNTLNLAIGEGYDTLHPFDFDKFCLTFRYEPHQCLSALQLLDQAGYLEYMPETEHYSRVMVTVHREELYSLKDITGNAERVLSAVLRSYTGLFAEYVTIHESRISAETTLSAEEVYQALLELARSQILSYVPRTRMPYIYVPTSREELRYIMIGKAIYENRREILSRRLEAMIAYAADNNSCRENFMLRYFGETSSSSCGQCDVCRSKARSPRDKRSRRELLLKNLFEFIKSRPEGADPRIISHRFAPFSDILPDMLAFLCNENYISYRDYLYYPTED